MNCNINMFSNGLRLPLWKGCLTLKGSLPTQVETTALEKENDGDDNEENGYNNKDNSGGENNGETWVNEGPVRQHLHRSYGLPAEKAQQRVIDAARISFAFEFSLWEIQLCSLEQIPWTFWKDLSFIIDGTVINIILRT